MTYDNHSPTAHDHGHQPVEIDAEAVYRAEHGWVVFTRYSKYVIMAIVAILVLMAIGLL